jgi:hypothetical protein
MSFANDLLEQSYHLAHRDTGTPKQASLRRAVSTACYAIFHLLIDEAVNAWSVERQRGVLARTFDHGRMKGVCDDVLKTVAGGAIVRRKLRSSRGRSSACSKTATQRIMTMLSCGLTRT